MLDSQSYSVSSNAYSSVCPVWRQTACFWISIRQSLTQVLVAIRQPRAVPIGEHSCCRIVVELQKGHGSSLDSSSRESKRRIYGSRFCLRLRGRLPPGLRRAGLQR